MDHPARRFLLYHGVLDVEGTAFDTFLDRDQALHLGEPWELGYERIPAGNWCIYAPIPFPSSPELAGVWKPNEDGKGWVRCDTIHELPDDLYEKWVNVLHPGLLVLL